MRRSLVVIADSDSYVKWGAALATRLPADWDARLVIVRSPVLPSARQLAFALRGTRFTPDEVRVAGIDELAAVVASERPDAVLLALRGPMVRVVVRVIGTLPNRPVLLSGFPGITIPAARKAVIYREQVDLVVLHSRREVRDFAANAATMPVNTVFGLATLPFLEGSGTGASPAARDSVVFAAQAMVPRTLEERVQLLGWLVQAARAQPQHRIVLKVRALAGEAQTHFEEYSLAELLHAPEYASEIGSLPPNLLVEDGPMADHLSRALALVTISSTAALEAIQREIPVLLLDAFGVSPALINTVFVGSGLFGGAEALIAGDYRHPDPAWLAENYFHGTADDDWVTRLEQLVLRRDIRPLELSPQRHNRTGGALRRAWDRKRMLGPEDASVLGALALVIAVPTRWTLRRMRAVRRRLSGGVLGGVDEVVLGVAPDAGPLVLRQGAAHLGRNSGNE
ncbi:DUF6716 putative glycosyltransferase [Rathayibacter sp. YIM 133350]|uniref:DUF6716 putative glycosyltransferase n=1 Tax=Rathayibacter sp. YIM 133350 TaxID=3131992 RepID=UPI00307E3D38